MTRKISSQALLGKRLLVIIAHPDDESYGCAGTLALHAKAGSQIFLLCATHGEKGQSHLPKPISLNAMSKKRKKELRDATKIIGIQKMKLLTYPDGKVNDHIASLTKRIQAIVNNYKPDCIISFGPCGISGHRDHVSAGVAAKNVAQKNHIRFAAMVLSKKLQRHAKKFLFLRRRSPHYIKHICFLNPNCTFIVNPRVKRLAIQSHASQMDGPKTFTGFPNYVVQGLLKREYFNIWKK